MKFIVQVLTNLFFLVCLTSCSEGKPVKPANVPNELLGIWKTECILMDVNKQDGLYHIIKDTITEDKIISEFVFFSDVNCNDKKGTKKLVVEPLFNGEKSPTSLGNAYQIDGTFVSRTIHGKSYDKGLGTTIYTVVYIKGSIMYYAFFDGTEGLSPKNRITKLDQRIKYVKQQ